MTFLSELQFAGFWMAVATFFGIWIGHVGVRWLEAHSPSIWPPAAAMLLGGLALNVYSLFAPSLTISGMTSIFGITLIWDSIEMWRQQRRVQQGHSPANPANPRHARYLAAGTATTEELLSRDPQGIPANTSPTSPALAKSSVDVKAKI